MRAITMQQPGPADVLTMGEAPQPELGPHDLRIAVRATSVNRADLLQREGRYPPPPGASPILGLECAGTVIEVGSNVTAWKIGARAMALLSGGGYAEEAVVHAGSVLPVPDALTDEEAAAVPEVFLTAFLNLFLLARVREGESALIHGGGSGVGTAATTPPSISRLPPDSTGTKTPGIAQLARTAVAKSPASFNTTSLPVSKSQAIAANGIGKSSKFSCGKCRLIKLPIGAFESKPFGE